MLSSTAVMLAEAGRGGYGVGAFNVYNLEGTVAVIRAAEELASPVIIQLLPSALETGGLPLLSLCLQAAAEATVPVSVHLDHCRDEKLIDLVITAGITSVMADGSRLSLEENIDFTRRVVGKARARGVGVEAELGRISGTEDGIAETVYEPTRADEAAYFVAETGVDALAVCIGNVHGKYLTPPVLDFDLFTTIANEVSVPLVLHGTSGLADETIRRLTAAGVSKFNVNTEMRSRCLDEIQRICRQEPQVELVGLMKKTINAMTVVVKEKILLFGSENRAEDIHHYQRGTR